VTNKGLWETVYFLRQGDFVKIGHTTMSVKRRLKSYGTHSLEETKLLGFTYGDKSVERAFHSEFSHYRERGEWFRFEGALADFIANALPLHQERAERSRLDELRRHMTGENTKVPRGFPRPPKKAEKKSGRKLIVRRGKVFTKQGKRVLTPRVTDDTARA